MDKSVKKKLKHFLKSLPIYILIIYLVVFLKIVFNLKNVLKEKYKCLIKF